MIKRILYISLTILLFNFTVKAQNIECIDNLINIPLAGYKAGNIQWQFSTNQTNWIEIENQNSASLLYHIQETGYFRAEIIDLACTYYSDTVFILAFPYPTVANAGPDQSYDDETLSATLSGNIPEAGYGTGYWRIVSGEGGSFVDSTDAGTVFTGNHCTDYTLQWTITTPCSTSSDDLLISFNQVPTVANAGPDQSYNDGTVSVTLTGNVPEEGHGTGYWSVVSGESGSFVDSTDAGTVFTGNHCTDYTLRWTITTPCSTSSDDLLISFNQVPTVANAGPDQSYDDGTVSVTLTGNVPEEGHGTGYWSVVSGESGSFVDSTDAGTIFSGNHCTDYTLRWTITTPCSNSSDDVLISFIQVPTVANAGPDQTYDDGTVSVTLAGNVPEAGHGTGQWSILSGEGGSFDDAANHITTFNGRLRTIYELQWRIATNCDVSTDNVIVSFFQDEAGETITDVEGNSYNTVWIGSQQWMAENLKTTKYNDGTDIPLVTDNTTWANLTTPGYCWFDNDQATYGATYGALYNGYTVETRNLCPAGWHVPTDAERTQLIDYLGGESVAGGKLKETGTIHWFSPNTGATNESGFTSLPGGDRDRDGGFIGIGHHSVWWGSAEDNASDAWMWTVHYSFSSVDRYYVNKRNGFSIRCLKDE